MRNRFLIVILSLMLVFSNIISVLAISFSSSAQSNNADMYVAKTYYFCNKSTWNCSTTSVYGSDTYDTLNECKTGCTKPSYTYTTTPVNYYVTTTTKPSYTYTTTPNYYYVTTTTKPSYTYTTTPVNYYPILNTTTTKPSYTYTTTPNYYYVTTTTKPSYTYATTPVNYYPTWNTTTTINMTNFNSVVYNYPGLVNTNFPTTTLLNYQVSVNTNINPLALMAVPTTTKPVYVVSSNVLNAIPIWFKPIPTTTKPIWAISDQNIIRTLDVSQAVTTTTKPMFSISDNVLVNPQDLTHKDTNILALLQANVLGLLDALLAKKLDTEDELQILAIGEEEKKVNGEKYLIVVVPTVDKDLFKKYIEEREDRFDIKIVSLQENGVKNDFQSVLAFIQKIYNEFPYTYLVFHEKIKIGEETAVWSETYSDTTLTYAPYWNWKDGIYFGIIRTNWLNKNKAGWLKLNNIEPSLFLTHEYSNRYTIGLCCDTGLPKYNNLINTFISRANSKLFFENRGTYPITEMKVDFQQLNAANFSQRFSNSNFVYANSTVEPINVWAQNYNWKYSLYNEPYTLIWNDKDKNEHADNSNSEIAFEKYWVNANDNVKRMLIIMGTNNFADKDYITFSSNYKQDINFYMSMIGQTVNLVNSNMSLAKAYRNAYDEFVNNLDPQYKNITHIPPGTFRVYGPPETILNDLIEEPKVDIQPDAKMGEKYIINIPKGKFEVDFLIKNIGKVDINYSFDKSNLVDITPIAGIIPVANETKIHLKILDHSDINIQSKDDINNNLKPKSTKIYFKSNAGNKELIVKYWDL